MKHELKTWPQYFSRVADGSKTFEYRVNDRGFQPGDDVLLREWDPKMIEVETYHPLGGDTYSTPAGYTQRKLEFKIGYVLPVSATHVVFSLLPASRKSGEG